MTASARLGAVLVGSFLAIALAAPLLAPFDPALPNLSENLSPPSLTMRKRAWRSSFPYCSPRRVRRRVRKRKRSSGTPVVSGSTASTSPRRRCTASGSISLGAVYSCTQSHESSGSRVR